MRRSTLALAVLAAAATATASLGAEESPGRYSMSPADGGVVRLDRETGAMSFCSNKDGAWGCTPMAGAGDGLRAEVERLEKEIGELRAENRRLAERSGSATEAPDTAPDAPQGNIEIPTEKDVDKLFDYVEGMVRKFRERIERLEKEKQPPTPL